MKNLLKNKQSTMIMFARGLHNADIRDCIDLFRKIKHHLRIVLYLLSVTVLQHFLKKRIYTAVLRNRQETEINSQMTQRRPVQHLSV